jgi:ribonucleoside-diphosphate reductase beta chain
MPVTAAPMLLDPGMDLTLRPMRHPQFYDRFRDRLVAFFATGDTIVSNNLVLNLYQHVNSPEGRLYLSR